MEAARLTRGSCRRCSERWAGRPRCARRAGEGPERRLRRRNDLRAWEHGAPCVPAAIRLRLPCLRRPSFPAGPAASFAQVQGLLEQVAGPHAAHLTFTQFAMLMHGAASGSGPQEEGASPRGARAGGWHRSAGGASPRRGASERRGRPAAAAAGGGGGREGEEELSWSDFHLLAKAFRCGVGGSGGWQELLGASARSCCAAHHPLACHWCRRR